MDRQEQFPVNQKCEILMPNGADICLEKNDCEKKVNIVMKKMKTINISGYVYDCNEKPVENAVVRLFEYEDCDHLRAVCYTFTNCDGFYVINLRGNFEGKYHIFVSECKEVKKRHHKDECNKNHNRDCDCNHDCDDDFSYMCDSMESYSCAGCTRNDCTKRQEAKKECNKIDYSNFI